MVIDRFRQFGSTEARWFDPKPQDPSLDGMNGIGSNSYVTDSAIPVFAACMLDFDPKEVGDIALRCQIDLERIHEYFELKNPGIIFSASGVENVDGVEFTKRLFRGMAAAYGRRENFLPSMKKAMSHSMIFALGIMDLGIEGLDMQATLDADLKFLKSYADSGFIDLNRDSFGETLSTMFDSISKIEHLPKSSTELFLTRSGALSPTIIRKSFGQGFWESMLYRKHGSHHVVFDTILRDLIEKHPKEASQILKSLDFDTQDQGVDIGLATWTAGFLEHVLVHAGMQSTAEDVSYKIGLLTSALPRDNALSFKSDNAEIGKALRSNHLFVYFHDLKDLGANLFDHVMESQISIEPEHISRSHFKVWGFLHGLEPVSQNVSPEKLSLYLGHMAKAAATLFPAGHENLELYAPFMVDQVADEVNTLIRISGRVIDYVSLRGLSEDAKEILSGWGLSLKDLDVRRSRTIEHRIGSDLGL
ncbi:hypothetical protein [Pseudomonas amygdali]|uniref:hypothetical protein n=1 Tax=Pseudomonas amygdali TaxID=47877 RepID=UPI0011C44969|nr:hypothetical protein [Pseudomonas amygdali]